ncbi:MAG: hypothetical protein A2X05_15675 [Bacteroidetes bacterium GWE2_41_25]|nr:MAG: hypothetical protein A2X03_03590 [Bacteroidetes bacterium GWA2_40_15]OFX92807.1 MAG: hypothetical protein A2X06_00765 [Bacteroidetes bacterium GWC2_40_22]OFY07936.1 MAG: hypothetical protein A2X05_15675 [Bacteroidetes bacterium GWE2_41_25]OFY58569.1 MAG: hypothetical protein A2X04_17010 [Bacteroidetes bacterium GWF2_41_9]HAM10487.1 hypothetical protein [Bacteroidales bacterium]
MKRVFVVIYIFSLLLTNASGQEVKVSSSFDTSRIYIGDQIRYTVIVDQPAGLQLVIPEFKDTLISKIEILSGPVTDSIRNIKGVLRIKKEYLVTSFDSGRYQIPPVYAEQKSEDGLKRFYSDYAYIDVRRIEAAPADSTAKIYDIIAPYRAPLTPGELLPWILIAVLAAVIIYFLVRLIRKLRKHESGHEVVVIPDPAHVIAFRDLENLREEKLWQKGEIKQYYTRLTEILRQYLENRFSVYSLELTTAETLEALVSSGFKKDSIFNVLKNVLSGADMVKFAKYNPEPSENELYYEDAWDFVSATREIEASAAEDAIKTETGEGAV